MDRLIRLLLASILVISLLALPVFADPGDESGSDGTGTTPDGDNTEVVWDNPDYPPRPPGFEGEWPPPDWNASTDGGGSGESDGGDEGGWDDPTQ
jgi:hypothetical protein